MLDYISPKYPKHLIKPEKDLRIYPGAAHIQQVSLGLSYWDIPETHRNSFCYKWLQCQDDGKTYAVGSRGGILVCGGCSKPPTWFGYYCVSCGDFFVRDFIDPRFCPYFAHCWDCLPKLKWSSCPTHGTDYPHTVPTKPLSPVGLNPKKFTADELEQAGINVFTLSG